MNSYMQRIRHKLAAAYAAVRSPDSTTTYDRLTAGPVPETVRAMGEAMHRHKRWIGFGLKGAPKSAFDYEVSYHLLRRRAGR